MKVLLLVIGVLCIQSIRSDSTNDDASRLVSINFMCDEGDAGYMAENHCLSLTCSFKGVIVEPLDDCSCMDFSSRIGRGAASVLEGITLPDRVELVEKHGEKRYLQSSLLEAERKKQKGCVFAGVLILRKQTEEFPEFCISVTCVPKKDKSQDPPAKIYHLNIKPMMNCVCYEGDNTPKPPTSSVGPTATEATPTPPNCDYASLSSDHSGLITAPQCAVDKLGVSEQDKIDILQIHNKFRSMVATGQENQGNPGPQPTATNMNELIWNDELAFVAQGLANTCEFKHDCGSCRRICSRSYAVGQNVFMAGDGTTDSKWIPGITAFYNEVSDFDSGTIDPYVFDYNTGHYTQVVWATTAEIGCGATYFGGKKIYVCNYGPSGNWINGQMYEQGVTASDCVFGTSSTYAGLCAPDPSL